MKKMQKLKIKNYNLQLNKLQVCMFASLRGYEFANFQNYQTQKLQLNNYKFTTLQIASPHLQVHEYERLQITD